MEPKDIENPEAELDFRSQLKAEKEVNFISVNPVLCDENCDPFFIKTDEHGYCKKCFKNLGYVRK